jgi:hypothetical protein
MTNVTEDLEPARETRPRRTWKTPYIILSVVARSTDHKSIVIIGDSPHTNSYGVVEHAGSS